LYRLEEAKNPVKGFYKKRCVQEGADKFQEFISVVKKRKSLDRQSKVDVLESEVRSLDPVLGRFWSPLPQITCPFVGELFAIQRALFAIQQVPCDTLLTPSVSTGADGSCEAPVSAQFSGFCLEHSLSEASPAYQEAIRRWVKTGQLQHLRELLRVNKEVQKEGTFTSDQFMTTSRTPAINPTSSVDS
jgi:hypothetical protein